MVDKEKRIQKYLNRIMLKGKPKTVRTLEEASIVIVEDPHSEIHNTFYDKKSYQFEISKGETFPEDRVHFLVPTNPRNRRQVARSVFTKTHGSMELTS